MTSVLVATLTPPDGLCSVSFTESMLRMMLFDATKDGMLIGGGGPMFLPASPNTISKMRNHAATYLLDDTAAEWLLFIDSDMGFSEDAPYQLLAAADPETAPVVGALCFGMFKTVTDERGGWKTKPFPTIYDWDEADDGTSGFKLRYDYTPAVVTRVAATGAAFLLIHRSVLEKVREISGDTWFDRARIREGEEMMGEDIAFCARVASVGLPVFVHAGVPTSHLKPVWVDEEYYRNARLIHELTDAS